MRILLTIMLVFAMAVGPAVAAGSCASIAGEHEHMAAASGPAAHDADMSGMAAEDCESMGAGSPQNHDNGCAAACALACPGFYNGPNSIDDHTVAFHSVRYAIPVAGPGPATPSHLDPPPPRA